MGAASRPALLNERARDHVDVKKEGSTLWIGIEDGAQFKCRVEIDLTRSQAAVDWLSISVSRQGESNYRVRLRPRYESPHLSG